MRKSAIENRTGELVSSIVYKTADGSEAAKFSYTYDAKGNITGIYRDGDLVTSYVYDSLGQLYRENNERAGKTIILPTFKAT